MPLQRFAVWPSGRLAVSPSYRLAVSWTHFHYPAIMQAIEPQPRLVLFDLDDTLCDYSGARVIRLRIAFGIAAGAQKDSVDLDRLVAESVRVNPHGVDHFDELLGSSGLDDQPAISAAKHWYLQNRFYNLHLFPDAIETLVSVRNVQPNRLVGIVTNGPAEVQTKKIDLLRIRPYCDVIVISDVLGIAKPDAGIFEEAFRLTGVPAADAIYIGDSPEFDIVGARNAGMRSIWLDRSGQAWPDQLPFPDLQARDLRTVRGLLGVTAAAAVEPDMAS